MKKLCTLVCLMLLASMLGSLFMPMTRASAAISNVIDSIAVTVPVPKPGLVPAADVTCTPASKVGVSEVIWYEGSGAALKTGARFEKGHIYRLRMVFCAVDGCTFAANFTKDHVTVNGETPLMPLNYVGDYNGSPAYIAWVDFECGLEALDLALDLDGYGPLAPGMALPSASNFCSGSHICVSEISWYQENGAKDPQITSGSAVTAGQEYYARITLAPETGWYFDTAPLDEGKYRVAVNGSEDHVLNRWPTVSYMRTLNTLTIEMAPLKATAGSASLIKTYDVLRAPCTGADSLGTAGSSTAVLGDGFGNWRPVSLNGKPGWIDITQPMNGSADPDTPVSLQLKGTVAEAGAVLSWSGMTNALGYLHRTSDGAEDATFLITAMATSYTDITLGCGKTAGYYIETISTSGTGNQKSNTVYLTRIASPTFTAAAEGNAIRVKWGKVEHAQKYTVYRDGAAVKTASADGSWLDTGVSPGNTYTYSVKAEGDGYGSSTSASKKVALQGSKASPSLVLTLPDTLSAGETGTAKVSGSDGAVSFTGKDKSVATVSSDGSIKALKAGKVSITAKTAESDRYYAASVSKTLTVLPAAVNAAAVNKKDGVSLSWAAADGADGYAILKKSGSSWTEAADTADTEWIDTELRSGETASYKVCAYVGTEKARGKYGEEAGVLRLEPVTLTVTNSTGITVRWTETEGATGYQVYRKVGEGSYTHVKSTAGVSWADKDYTDGETYSYKVRAYGVAEDGSKVYSAFCSPETLVSLHMGTMESANTASGLKISWDAAGGAHAYQIYRSTDGGAYTKVKSVTGLSWTDTDAVSGSVYTYKIRAYTSSTPVEYSAFKATEALLRVGSTAATLTNATGIKVSWEKLSGVTGYQIFRRTGSGAWTKVKTAAGTAWTDTDVTAGTVYEYRIRAYFKDETVTYGAYGASAELLYLPPGECSLTAAAGSVTVSWTKVSAAYGYQIYRKEGSGAYALLKTSAGSSYKDTAVKAGTTYTYKVRCYVKGESKNTYSAFGTAVSVKAK